MDSDGQMRRISSSLIGLMSNAQIIRESGEMNVISSPSVYPGVIDMVCLQYVILISITHRQWPSEDFKTSRK